MKNASLTSGEYSGYDETMLLTNDNNRDENNSNVVIMTISDEYY